MEKQLAQYQELEQQECALKAQKEQLRQRILADLKKKGIDKYQSEYGTFSLATRTTYTYSEKVEQLAEKLKLAKVKEVQKGTAEAHVSEGLRYTPMKK